LRFGPLQRFRSASRCPPAAGCADDPASALASARASLMRGQTNASPLRFFATAAARCDSRRVTTESELARAGRSWCWSPLVCQAAAPHVSSIFNPASGRTSMHDSLAGQPREKYSRAAPVFAASHAPRSFLSFPRGVPLLASLEHSRPCRTSRGIRPRFTSGSAPGVH
jgi:hypothetical protein